MSVTSYSLRATVDRLQALTHGHLPLDVQAVLVDAAEEVDRLVHLNRLQGQTIQLLVAQIHQLEGKQGGDRG